MKKLFIVTLVVGAVSLISSCKKDYTCECTILGITGDDSTLVGVTKKEAKDYCNDQNTVASLFGGSCQLK
jgi:hypothetical protein